MSTEIKEEPVMEAKILKDRNAGNSHNTYYKGWSEREYCIQTGSDYVRDAAGRVRRFTSRGSAEKAAEKAGFCIASQSLGTSLNGRNHDPKII